MLVTPEGCRGVVAGGRWARHARTSHTATLGVRLGLHAAFNRTRTRPGAWWHSACAGIHGQAKERGALDGPGAQGTAAPGRARYVSPEARRPAVQDAPVMRRIMTSLWRPWIFILLICTPRLLRAASVPKTDVALHLWARGTLTAREGACHHTVPQLCHRKRGATRPTTPASFCAAYRRTCLDDLRISQLNLACAGVHQSRIGGHPALARKHRRAPGVIVHNLGNASTTHVSVAARMPCALAVVSVLPLACTCQWQLACRTRAVVCAASAVSRGGGCCVRSRPLCRS